MRFEPAIALRAGLAELAVLVDGGEDRRGDREHARPTAFVHIVHRHDRAVFQRERLDLVREHLQAALRRVLGDGVCELRIAGIVVGHVLDHVRRLMARIDAFMSRIGVHVTAEVGDPVHVEDEECVGARALRARADFA